MAVVYQWPWPELIRMVAEHVGGVAAQADVREAASRRRAGEAVKVGVGRWRAGAQVGVGRRRAGAQAGIALEQARRSGSIESVQGGK